MLLIDLAVPRDIDAACAEIAGVSLYDIDDLEAVIARNRKVRQAEARTAEGIIEEEIQHFAAWLGSLEVLPTIAALRAARRRDRRAGACAENAGKWESASPRDLERVDALARAIVNRLLHEPTVRMKELRDDRVHARMALVRELFGLAGDEVALGRGRRSPAPSRRPAPGRRSPRSARRARAGALMRIGTRGSALALAQAGWVAERLGPDAELVDDHDRRRPRARGAGDKSRWVSELERALLAGEIDLAVHSAKDVPAELADGPRARRRARRAPIPATRSAAPPRSSELPPGRAGRHEQPAPGGPAARGPRRPRGGRGARQRRHAAAQARRRRGRRAGAGDGRARAARPRRPRPAACSTARPGRRAGRARRRGRARGADAAASSTASRTATHALCVTAERELTRALGRQLQHAGRRPRPADRRRRARAASLGRAARRLGVDRRRAARRRRRRSRRARRRAAAERRRGRAAAPGRPRGGSARGDRLPRRGRARRPRA